MGGADDEDAGAFGEGVGGPAGTRDDQFVDRGGDGRLLGDAQLGEQVRQRTGGGLLGLIIDGHAHVKSTLPRGGQAGKRRFGVARAGRRAWLKPMKTLRLCLLSAVAIVAALTLSSCNNKEQMKDSPAAGTPRAIIHTNYGDMTVEFWPDVAPRTVENFLKLSREKFYDGSAFHRVIKGFMIQGGCPNSKVGARGKPGTGTPGYTIKAEFNNRKHEKGVLSMARGGYDVDSAGSQFFICLARASHLDNQYTAFGKLVAGEEVLNRIGNVTCAMNAESGNRETPTERVEITSIELVEAK